MIDEVLKFWFKDIEPSQHWVKDPSFDELIANKFGELHKRAIACELYQWRKTAQGSLAEIIVLDQFSRNIYRDQSAAFDSDPLALALSQRAIESNMDKELTIQECSFLYMPFMHSESPEIHVEAVKLYEKLGTSGSLEFELKHKEIIDRFGRYPHRNNILGRVSTAEEIQFLQQPNSSF